MLRNGDRTDCDLCRQPGSRREGARDFVQRCDFHAHWICSRCAAEHYQEAFDLDDRGTDREIREYLDRWPK